MTDTPTFPVLKLLTDQEVERALARPYSLQEGADGRDYLRSDKPGRAQRFINICFFGVAFDAADSPSRYEISNLLAPRAGIHSLTLFPLVNDFVDAVDRGSTFQITTDEQLREIVRASREGA